MSMAPMNSRHIREAAPREWTAEVAGEVLGVGDRVMHPAHGVGRVERIAVQDISGFSLEFIVVVFDEARMTLRVPSNKARTIGLRRIASQALINEALAILKGRPKQSKIMWARRAQENEAKINSGDPRIIAEVVRDLNGNAISGTQSFSERAIYETAVDRLAGEIAVVEGMDKAAAIAKINRYAAPAGAEGT
jgi:CarD family transcriptional regulator